ncbi:hypothetical protein [Klebsiella oxytoca]|uniref:Uncharacterized protein n=1 Tax=Klebsiella oxytoca TaxID=571 RepID=A0A6B8MP16_KLEOX|nr:hypothetical protein [Klebsiella oxytoca]QGN36154.1 hypothetical protein GJ746_02020 [Klebsiella oxytoca]
MNRTIFLTLRNVLRVALPRYGRGNTILPGIWRNNLVIANEQVTSRKLTFPGRPGHQMAVGIPPTACYLNSRSLAEELNQEAICNGAGNVFMPETAMLRFSKTILAIPMVEIVFNL